MSIMSMIGYDHYATGDIPLASAAALLAQPFKVPMSDGSVLALNSQLGVGSANHTLAIAESADDPTTKQLRWTISGTNNNAANATRLTLPFGASGANRTGKWYVGLRLIVDALPSVSSRFVKVGTTVANDLWGPSAVGEYFLEFIADYSLPAASGLSIYVNGDLVKTTSSSAAITIGQNYGVEFGSYYWAFAVGSVFSIRDIYFVTDLDGDENPTGRLGPCRVRTSRPVSFTGNRWESTNEQTPVEVLGKPITSDLTPAVLASAFGDVATAQFDTPPTQANYGEALAVQVNILGTRKSSAQVRLKHGLVEGEETIDALSTTVKTILIDVQETPPGGGSWSEDKIKAVAVSLSGVQGL